MTTDALRTPAATVADRPHPRLRIDKRYLAPILVTLVLVVGQVTFGFLESWSRTALAIAVAKADRSAQIVRPKEIFSTLHPVKTLPDFVSNAAPTKNLEYGA